ncbi:MAG: hypothetical protein WC472_04310 [Candidatus Paceibacterota bacterium]
MKLNQLENFQEKIENVKSISIGKYHNLLLKFLSFSFIFFIVLGMIFLIDMFLGNRIGMLAKSYEENFLLGDFVQYFVDSYMFLFDLLVFPFCFYWGYLMKKMEKNLLSREPEWGEKILLLINMFFVVVTAVIIIFMIILSILL